jgi:pectin methylesterase-like acyl-CoA thioesterase
VEKPVANNQRNRTLQQATTSLTGAQVLTTAREFFQSQSGIYAAFVEQEGPTHLTLRGLGGEEIAVGVATVNGATAVNASSYMFDQQVAYFLSSLPPAEAPAGAAR